MFAILLAAALFDANMSPQEMNQTGMSKLSAQEKQALQKWLDANYTKKSPAVAQSPKSTTPTLQENLKNGTFIRLTDNTLWEIKPSDTPITQGWITPVEIKVAPSNDTVYPYTLTNTLTGSSVKARKAQSIPPSSPSGGSVPK